jgi:DNA polymerase I-like protein with 3'-5' exonuclease and polymerase domains
MAFSVRCSFNITSSAQAVRAWDKAVIFPKDRKLNSPLARRGLVDTRKKHMTIERQDNTWKADRITPWSIPVVNRERAKQALRETSYQEFRLWLTVYLQMASPSRETFAVPGVKQMKLASFDVETSGTLPEYALQPWRHRQGKAWLTSLAWVWRQDGKTLHGGGLKPGPRMIRNMLTWAYETEHILVGWNVVFDLAWLYAYADNEIVALLDRVRFLDAMLLWRHLDIEPEYAHTELHARRSYSLKTAVPLFFPQHAGYEADVDYHGTDPAELQKLHEYNIKDCVFTLRLARRFWHDLSHAQQTVAITEAASFKMVARANLEGLIVDTLEAGNLSACLRDKASTLLASLAPHGITEKIVRSPKQLGNVLFDQWKLPSTGVTTTGARSTAKAVLHKLVLQNPRVKAIKEYREAVNNNTKFAVAPLIACAYNQDHRAHPQARVFGTYSGRMTFSSKQSKNKGTRQIGFALHQMKRDPMFRRIIVPPQGFALMEFDAAGQEYRWMAIASGDETMLQLCQPGEDPHAFMGSRINRAFTYKQIMKNAKLVGSPEANARQCGKVVNLSSQYRVGYKKLQQIAEVDYNISISIEEAYRIQRVYLITYPGVERYWIKQVNLARIRGYVETIPGRRVKVTGEWGSNLGWQMEGTAINYPVQGTGAEQKYLALRCVREYINGVGARFAFDLHDGLYFFVPTEKIYDVANHMKDILDNLPYEAVWKFKPPIPLPWNCKIGPSWGDLVEFK